MYCSNCGKEIDDKAILCTHCGVMINDKPMIEDENDDHWLIWGIIGAFVPMAGLVLYLVWKDSKPRTSKAVGIGFLIGLVVYVAFYFLAISFILQSGSQELYESQNYFV